jgi:hypothetical protein
MIHLLMMALQAAAPAAVTPPPPPPWTPRMKTDPATKQSSGSVSATSRDGSARLVIRCDHQNSNVVSVQFIPATPFIVASPRPVSIIVDGGMALGANWEFPGRGAMVWDEAIVTTLTVAIAHGKEIKVHVIDPSEKVIDATFPGPSSEAPIKQVVEACGYTFGVVPGPPPAPATAETPDQQP